MEKPILISIILPMYNVSRYIEECLRSVCAQTMSKGVECIIVDDCSTDACATLANNAIVEYNGEIKFKIIHHETNKGVSAARNTGMKNAQGDYFFFLDGDDLMSKDCLEKLYSVAREYLSADIVQGNTYCEGPLALALRIDNKAWRREYSADVKWLRRMLLLSKIPPTAWNKLTSAKFITRNNLYFNEDITTDEDNLWTYFVSKHIGAMAFCMKPTYKYRDNPNGITANRSIDKNKRKSFAAIINDMLTHIDKPTAQLEFMSILKYSYMLEPDNKGNTQFFKLNPIYKKKAFQRLYHYYCIVNKTGRRHPRGLYAYIIFKLHLIYICKKTWA